MNNYKEWRTIPGFSKYEINRNGIVRNKKRKRMLKTSVNNKGYHRVKLTNDNNERKALCIHKLVLITYVFNPFPKKWIQGNHKDGDKNNNHVSNLEWCDNTYNMRHSFKIGTHRTEKKKKAELKNLELANKANIKRYALRRTKGV